MSDGIEQVDLARLRARADWSGSDDEQDGADRGGDGVRRECAATRTGHVALEMEPGELPRCRHCGETLSPDALRRAGVKGKRA